MITWVKFKYEHVINACFTPAPGVYGQQECDEHKKEDSSVNTDSDVELATVICEKSWITTHRVISTTILIVFTTYFTISMVNS